ncbi:MAG: Methionine-tRNA ligase [Parcubacteria group bacterium GW2011_GWA1_47_8]|nr:MAG: Methionine-tRNA ligase [Parcubacteria group bacterium GW2011_GWA1_47_8]
MSSKFYITTPIFYANAKLHIGHSYTLVLADIVARYHRAQGEETFFLTGADEHGDKILRTAQAAGMSPQAFVDQNVAEFKELMVALEISNDFFVRTSDSVNHWPGALALWQGLVAAGDVRKGIYQGLYCVGCEAFITEKDLVDGKCALHNTLPEHIEEENYFFSLAKYGPELKRLIETGTLKITPASKAHEMLALIATSGKDGGLGDISISRPEREIPWGIPVPEDPSQLMYVWCDALSNYLSALGYGRADDEKFRTFASMGTI